MRSESKFRRSRQAFCSCLRVSMLNWLAKLHCRCSWRALVSALLSMLVLASSLGIPTIEWKSLTTGAAYPCQFHNCGCKDASTLWRNCCCYTLEQKVAWARSRGIKVPNHVQQKLKNVATAASSKRSCCDKRATCSTKSALNVTLGLLRIDDYHRCKQGQEVQRLLAHGLILELGPVLTATLVLPWPGHPTDHFCQSICVSPPTPPPRHS